jgi:hypothetical protein
MPEPDLRRVQVTGVWVLEHVGRRPPTMNEHRRLHPHQRAAVDREWRAAFALLARAQHVPHLDAVTLEVVPLHRDRRSPQDTAACAPAEKAARDGLVDAGVIDDDRGRYVPTVTFHQPQVVGVDGLRLIIREAAA